MKIEYKRKIRHYLVVDKNVLTRLFDVTEKLFDEVIIKGTTKDGSKIIFDSSEELLKYDNFGNKAIVGLIISNKSEKDNIFDLTISLGKNDWDAFNITNGYVSITHNGDSEAIGFEEIIKKEIKKMKPTYSFMKYMKFKWVGFFWPFPIIIIAYLAVSIKAILTDTIFEETTRNIVSINFQSTFVLIWLVSASVMYLLDKFKNYLYPPFVFSIGEKINELNTVKCFRVLFNTIFTGIVIAVITAILKIG